MVQTNREKADTLAHNIANACRARPDETDIQRNCTNIITETTRQTYPIPPPLLLKLHITPTDIKNTILHSHNHKAPGPDDIPNVVLKNLPRKTITQLTYIINAIILLQHFPIQWRNAIVVPILKPGKNPNNPDSYRPVSLVNSLSKVTERLLMFKMSRLGLCNKIPKEQFGFRAGHSTTMAVAKVVQDALNNTNNKQNTVLLALDMSKAFDTVWHQGLLYKLLTYQDFLLPMIALLNYYLKDRSIRVK